MPDSWFGGTRTLREQMRGVEPVLAEAAGKRVLDLGCAEGLISLEFARAGAAHVDGVDFNAEFIAAANKLKGKLPVRFEWKRVEELIQERREYDIVLALAILHKLQDPAAAMRWIFFTGARLVVVRLPRDSKGTFETKHHRTPCNVIAEMRRNSFALERTAPGPRGELVQHYRRG